MRIGQGFDAHQFSPQGKLIIGGVEIPFDRGVEAHSDGDVLLHAICDALLGAAGLGDIGKHFSDSDNANKDRNSREFIAEVSNMLESINLSVINVDATVILQAPKIRPYIDNMQEIIAQDLNIESACVNIKATTTEHMGFVGREEGIAAMAVVLLK